MRYFAIHSLQVVYASAAHNDRAILSLAIRQLVKQTDRRTIRNAPGVMRGRVLSGTNCGTLLRNPLFHAFPWNLAYLPAPSTPFRGTQIAPALHVQTSNYRLVRPWRQSQGGPESGSVIGWSGEIRPYRDNSGRGRRAGFIPTGNYLDRASHFVRNASCSRLRTVFGSGKSLPSQ